MGTSNDQYATDEAPLNVVVGNRLSHHTARKKLRKKLRDRGLPAEEIEARVAALQQRQASARRLAQQEMWTCALTGKRHSWRYGRGIKRCKRCGYETDSEYKSAGAWVRERLRRRDGDFCLICGGGFTEDDPATIDHIKPQADGGTDAMENLRLAHQSCNNIRGRGQDPHIDGRTGLPHPRWVDTDQVSVAHSAQ